MQFGWRGKKVRQPMTRRPVTGGSRQDASDMRLPAPGTHRMEWVLRLTLAGESRLLAALGGPGAAGTPEDGAEGPNSSAGPGRSTWSMQAVRRPTKSQRRGSESIAYYLSAALIPRQERMILAGFKGCLKLARNRERTPRLAGIRATYHHRRANGTESRRSARWVERRVSPATQLTRKPRA